MRVLGYPTKWDEEAGLTAIGLSDLQLHGSPEEFESPSAYLHECASCLRAGRELPASLNIGNHDTLAETGLSFMVFANK